jgi:diguanylate cyclase (GGDEF)-like protein
MAKIIQTKHIRPKDIFGRYGGEEFILILSSTPGHAAAELAERIRIAIEVHPFIYENKRLPVTVSMGVAEIEVSSESSQSLIKNADKALYIAKNNGRNQVVKN